MSTNLQDFQRNTGKTPRKDLNKILESLQDLFAAPAEKEAVAQRIARTKNIVEIDQGIPDATEWTASLLLEDGTSYLLTESDVKIKLELQNGNN